MKQYFVTLLETLKLKHRDKDIDYSRDDVIKQIYAQYSIWEMIYHAYRSTRSYIRFRLIKPELGKEIIDDKKNGILKQFRVSIDTDDKVFIFSHNWDFLAGYGGYALVRNGKIIDTSVHWVS